MRFGNFFRTIKERGRRVLGQVVGSASKRLRFFNGTVVPTAHKAHKLISDVNKAVQDDKDISQKNKERAGKVSKFSDLGLSKLNEVAEKVNKVNSALAG